MICLSEKKFWVRQSMCLPNPKKDLPKANEVIALGKITKDKGNLKEV